MQLQALAERQKGRLREELARQGLAENTHAGDVLDLQYQQTAAEYESAIEERAARERTELLDSVTNSLAKLEALESHARGAWLQHGNSASAIALVSLW